jgi:hypothetical protein
MVPRKKLPFATLYANIEPEMGREKIKEAFSVIPGKRSAIRNPEKSINSVWN